MAIPPFPSQDLAKLVLGYLAEEQLMTAYDEFLQASPYLDAMHNEYDRIFMTSLKNILAEYRAVKIYVETCKPFLLRKKLFQCVNLLEIVKFLVNNIDVNKIYAQDIGEKNSLEKQNISFKNVQCDVCSSLKLPNCVCKSKQYKQNISHDAASQIQAGFLQNSIETTALADLPGNHGTVRKKQVKKLDKKSTLLQCNDIEQNVKQQVGCLNDSMQQLPKYDISGYMNNTKSATVSTNSNVQPSCEVLQTNPNLGNTAQPTNNKTEVCQRNKSTSENKGISSASTFKDFASGVRGCENGCAPAPDSSTSDNTWLNKTPMINNELSNHKEPPRSGIILQIEPFNRTMKPHGNTSIATINRSYAKLLPKTEEQRIKILSDIKVDNSKNSHDRKLIPPSRNATSTPLIQRQTIVINGTPAYRPHSINTSQQNFTKDEIMAMPTIIVVPASDPQNPQLPTRVPLSPLTSQSSQAILHNKSYDRALSPLVLDVPSCSSEENFVNNEVANIDVNVANEVGLVKTADNVAQHKMTSLPKDCITTCTAETSTPMILPALRKSSSTPRRTSHVRVLDFATPRRVLNETIKEQTDVKVAACVTVDVSKNNNISEQIDCVTSENTNQKSNVNTTKKSSKDTTETVLPKKKTNWDDDLRALIGTTDVLPKVKKKASLKTYKKKKDSTNKSANKNDIDDNSSKKKKSRKSKKKLEEEDEPDPSVKPNVVPVKPTINIKPGTDRCTSSNITKKETEDRNQMKNNEEKMDTPEVDRISLQNVIGAKLNISEFLETPYKQVFYDIQMDTPRCLGPDMPDDPISAIKILSIPTPRLFGSPKIVQAATPSTYSSRPTDYSSGGSYYKPDDQDYYPMPDIICPVTSSKQESNIELLKTEIIDKKTRPVRQCAKNVSYFSSHKIQDQENKTDVASTCSETTCANTTHDLELDKDKNFKVNKPNESTKSERNKRGRKKKPAVKEKPKTFMKIKPRRVTPTKETLSGKSRKKPLQSNSPKLSRKRTTSKEKNINITPIVSSIPTKSRRKSSTPRKLHCSKTFNSESSGHNSPEISDHLKQRNVARDTNSIHTQDSDNEQLNLRWSDEGSQDVKVNEVPKNICESEDISQIQEFIKTTVIEESTKEINSVLQTHLVKRGFDEVTAKIIERDLLDTPPHTEPLVTIKENILGPINKPKDENIGEKSFDTDSSITNDLQIVSNNGDDEVELDFTVHENNEGTNNWYSLNFDETMKEKTMKPVEKLKDTFSMELCVEDDISIRLRATPFHSLFDLEVDQYLTLHEKETQAAVESISNIDKLYTPLKTSAKAQCYQLFDSTLTSLDTPLKMSSPKRNCEVTVTEIILDEEEDEKYKDKTESKKRKRFQNSNGSDDSLNESKKTKPNAQYLTISANIQNMDIESVLTKLHGP